MYCTRSTHKLASGDHTILMMMSRYFDARKLTEHMAIQLLLGETLASFSHNKPAPCAATSAVANVF